MENVQSSSSILDIIVIINMFTWTEVINVLARVMFTWTEVIALNVLARVSEKQIKNESCCTNTLAYVEVSVSFFLPSNPQKVHCMG